MISYYSDKIKTEDLKDKMLILFMDIMKQNISGKFQRYIYTQIRKIGTN